MVSNILALFPLWAILASVVAYFNPAAVVDYKGWIVPLLMMIMFCMGVTLTLADFIRALKRPRIITITALLQFIIMPLAALAISKALGFSIELTVGMVLVGAVSGGTASNVMVYLAKGDVALSITMTAVSTLLSVVLTPFLAWLYVGQSVPVPAASMLIGIVKIVIAPVALGIILNMLFNRFITGLQDVFAVFSVMAIIFIVAIVVGLNHERIASVGLVVVLGIILHNFLGLLSGYYVTKFLGYEKTICRTVAIEVGMQNSGLAVALALKYFAPLAALPGALFSIWHNISGSLVAGYWSKSAED